MPVVSRESKSFDEAFENMLSREVAELRTFSRHRSLTPPPDLVSRAMTPTPFLMCSEPHLRQVQPQLQAAQMEAPQFGVPGSPCFGSPQAPTSLLSPSKSHKGASFVATPMGLHACDREPRAKKEPKQEPREPSREPPRAPPREPVQEPSEKKPPCVSSPSRGRSTEVRPLGAVPASAQAQPPGGKAWGGKGPQGQAWGGKGPGPPPAKGKGKGKGSGPGKATSGSWLSGQKLHWRELAGAGDASGSIFAESGAVDIDFEECAELFRQSGSSQPKPRARLRSSSEVAVCVLSSRQATNVGIVLRKVGDLAELVARLEGDESMAEEDLERLQQLLALVDEKQLAHLRRVPASELREVERALLPLTAEKLGSRLKVARVCGSAETQSAKISEAAGMVQAAAQEALDSALLKDLIRAALRLRSFVLHGPEASEGSEGGRVMDLGSLLSGMREFKGPQEKGRESLLRFFARSMLRVRENFDSRLSAELPSLSEASQICWKAVVADHVQLRSDVSFLARELEADRRQLLSQAQQALSSADAAVAESLQLLEQLAQYFGLRKDRKDELEPSGLNVLRQLADLLHGFCRECAEERATVLLESRRGQSPRHASRSPVRT